MIENPFRASTVACAMAILAFPAVADTTTIRVINNTLSTVTSLYIDGASLKAWTVDRLPGMDYYISPGPHGYSMDIECDPSGNYGISALYLKSQPIRMIQSWPCGVAVDVNIR